MNNTEKSRTMTAEEILNDPSLAQAHAFIRKVENGVPASQLVPKKHALALISHSATQTKTLYAQHPNMPIKKVLTTIFERLTDDIPPALMLKLTKNIINLWTKLDADVQQKAVAVE